MLQATGAVRLLMRLGIKHREMSGGTTGSGCRHRLVTMERSAGLNTGVMLTIVNSSSREHRHDKISNRAGRQWW